MSSNTPINQNASKYVIFAMTARDGPPLQALAGLYPVDSFCLRPPRRTGVVLGYAPLREREIREGIRRLAVALV